jgi:hypothetical protein
MASSIYGLMGAHEAIRAAPGPIYRLLAATWRFYDNGGSSAPRLIPAGRRLEETSVRNTVLWQTIKAEHEGKRRSP